MGAAAVTQAGGVLGEVEKVLGAINLKTPAGLHAERVADNTAAALLAASGNAGARDYLAMRAGVVGQGVPGWHPKPSDAGTVVAAWGDTAAMQDATTRYAALAAPGASVSGALNIITAGGGSMTFLVLLLLGGVVAYFVFKGK